MFYSNLLKAARLVGEPPKKSFFWGFLNLKSFAV